MPYDVFLSHNSKDKALVRELKRRLQAEKLTVWLDEDELRPGVPWQQLLETGIRASKSVAVLVGKDGVGPWEDEEMQAALILAVKNKSPVIPVLLPGTDKLPQLPIFLGSRTWVSLGNDLDDDAIAKLVWGITGAKPQRSALSTPGIPAAETGTRVLCRVSCAEKYANSLHGRPLAFLNKFLLSRFPNTEFRLSHYDAEMNVLGRPANMRSGGDMMISAFQHGEIVILDVTGKLEVMASSFVKTALENLDGYSDNPKRTKEKIRVLIDELYQRLYDPDLDEIELAPFPQRPVEQLLTNQEHRVVAVINDRLHDVTLPALSLMVRYFRCKLQIAFELAEKGVFVFLINAENDFTLESRVVELDIPVGTRITILTTGEYGEEAALAIRNVLQNLWQCDQWLRNRAGDWNTDAAISDLIGYAQEMERTADTAYSFVHNPFISNLIGQSVIVNPPGKHFSKAQALAQLSELIGGLYEIAASEILTRIQEVESKQVIIPRPGFAIAHTAMERSPRIAIAFGVFPEGTHWSDEHERVQLVAVVLCARDTYRTWADYRRKFAILFRSIPSLMPDLLKAKNHNEFIKTLRSAEISLAKPKQ